MLPKIINYVILKEGIYFGGKMVIIPNFQKEEEILKTQQEKNLMVDAETFASLIRKHIFPQLSPYEAKRKRLKKWFYFSICLSVVLFLIVFTIAQKNNLFQKSDDGIFILLFSTFLPVAFSYFRNMMFLNDRKEEFLTNILSYAGTFHNHQETITPEFLNNSQMFPNFVFKEGHNQSNDIAKNAFNLLKKTFQSTSAGLFKKYCQVLMEENFTGHYKSTKFSVAETKLIYTTGSGKNRRDKTLFRGVLIAIPLQKEIVSQTVAYNEIFTFDHTFTDFERVDLEDEDFMKEYNIYSTSQIDPRFILSPVFIERLKKLKKAFNTKKIDFAIFDNHILLFVHIRKNLFEPFSIFKSFYNMEVFLNFYREIESICNLVDTLQISNEKERKKIF